MPPTHPLCRNNPLVPYAARPGSGPCVLEYPETLSTAKAIIRSISSLENMVRQCGTCHRFITGAPRPELGHQDGPAGPECSLPHHPQPCPWVSDRTGQPCSYVPAPPLLLPPLTTTSTVSATTSPATISETLVGATSSSVPDELARLRREKEEAERNAELLRVANRNLQASQQHLLQQQSALSVPFSSSTTTTTATSTFSSLLSSRPAMGIGYSSGFGVTAPSSLISLAGAPSIASAGVPSIASAGVPSIASAGIPSQLMGAAQNLSQLNAPPSSVPHSIPGYGGPLIPELRAIPDVNAFTQQVLNNIYQHIPALAPVRSASVQPPPASVQAPAQPPVSVPPLQQAPLLAAAPQLLPELLLQQPPASQPVAVSQAASYFQQQLPAPAGLPPHLHASAHQHQQPQAVPPLPGYQAQLQHGGGGYLQPQPFLGAHQPQPHHQAVNYLDQDMDQVLNRTQVSQSHQDSQVNHVASLENLLSATIKFKQYFALDFARLAKFPYISQLKHSNMNLALYAYGSVKHLLLLSDGTLPSVSKREFIARLQHILNVLDITCLGSGLGDFTSHSFNVAKEYDLQILNDIQMGKRSWETLSHFIDPTAWAYSRDMIPAQTNKSNQNQAPKNQSSSQKMCTTFNTFKNGPGCSYEYNHPGESCVYVHQCSACNKRGFPNRRHKSINCRDEAKLTSNSQTTQSVTSPSVSSAHPAVPVTSV